MVTPLGMKISYVHLNEVHTMFSVFLRVLALIPWYSHDIVYTGRVFTACYNAGKHCYITNLKPLKCVIKVQTNP